MSTLTDTQVEHLLRAITAVGVYSHTPQGQCHKASYFPANDSPFELMSRAIDELAHCLPTETRYSVWFDEGATGGRTDDRTPRYMVVDLQNAPELIRSLDDVEVVRAGMYAIDAEDLVVQLEAERMR